MEWPAGFIAKMDYCKLVYTTLTNYKESGALPSDNTRQEIIEDYTLLDSFVRTGNIPDASDDNDFRERTLAFKELLDD